MQGPSGMKLVRFAHKHDVNLDWLLSGDTAHVGRHLAKDKVAILPAKGAHHRERVQKYHRALLKADVWRRAIIGPDDPKPPLDCA